MFERFTERARQVVVLAQDEARSLQHNYIGTEHLLLGLLREEEGVAARVLEGLDITLEEVQAQVARIVGRGDEGATGQIPFTPRAKKALELSLREAMRLGHNYIGTEHILLGLVAVDQGVAVRILLDFDAAPDKIQNETLRMLSGPGGPSAGRTYRTSSGVPPELADEIEKVVLEKEKAIEAQEFDRAATLRDRERTLRKKARALSKGLPEFEFESAPPVSRSVQAADESQYRPSRMERIGVPVVLGWTLFGVAFGLGILAGWLIWA
jgi:hypothetical protein